MSNQQGSGSAAAGMQSLRYRYLIVALISVLSVLVVIVVEHTFITSSSETRQVNSESRVTVRRISDALQEEMAQVTRQLDLYLIEPKAQYRNQFIESLNSAKRKAEQLHANNWVISKEMGFDIDTLRIKLGELDSNAEKLMQIRLQANEMFPAMKLANGSMLVANRTFITKINYAILESQEIANKNDPVYKIKLSIRDEWRKMINAYRLYLINRLGSLFEQALESQARDIHAFYKQIDNLLHELEKYEDHDYMGFESAEAIDVMKDEAANWYEGFNEVERINRTKAWRGDVPIIVNNVYPLVDEVQQILSQLNTFINFSAAQDLREQDKVTFQLTVALWVLFVLLVGIIIFSYFLLDNSLLRPISKLANTLKTGAENPEALIPKVNNLEMSEFINAFRKMRNQIKVRQDQLEHLAMHDSLTSLPNRTLLVDRLNFAINMSQRNNITFSLIILDLDRFKEVNDTLGHLIGDKLLCEVADRLSQMLRETDTVARLGGDEFAIILTDISYENIEVMANKIAEELERVYVVDEHNLYLGVSLGIAIYPNHGTNTDQLMKHADIAMYEAKKSTSHYSIYEPENDIHNIKKLSLLSDLRVAIDKGELVLHYQPINSLKDNSILGFEALLRWQHPGFGMIGPDMFIHLAEQTGLIRKITQWVVKEAVKQVKQWHDTNPGLYVSVNVTAWDLYEPAFVETV